MKIEIEKSEYDRLKSREEKLMAYYEWFVDKENDLATVEDIVNENIELRNTLEDVYKKKRELGMEKVRLKALSEHKTEMVMKLGKIKDELEEENKKLKDRNTILEKGGQVVFTLEKRIDELLEENKKLKEELRMLKKGATLYREDNKKLKERIKDHQLYEEKLEHRIIEFEELLHGE